MVRAGQDPAEGSREVVDRELRRDGAKHKTNMGGRTANNGSHPQNKQGAAKATKDNASAAGHPQKSDGGDDNRKRKH